MCDRTQQLAAPQHLQRPSHAGHETSMTPLDFGQKIMAQHDFQMNSHGSDPLRKKPLSSGAFPTTESQNALSLVTNWPLCRRRSAAPQSAPSQRGLYPRSLGPPQVKAKELLRSFLKCFLFELVLNDFSFLHSATSRLAIFGY